MDGHYWAGLRDPDSSTSFGRMLAAALAALLHGPAALPLAVAMNQRNLKILYDAYQAGVRIGFGTDTSATVNAAALLGADDADLLADIRNTRRIRTVWQRGREGDSRPGGMRTSPPAVSARGHRPQQ
jgi:hypothetical protein